MEKAAHEACQPLHAPPTTRELPRPYLRQSTKTPAPPPSFQLDFQKLLGGNAPISWGQLLAHLPKEQVDQLLAAAR